MMMIIKRIILMLVLISASAVIAQPSPIPMLEDAANQILTTLKTNKSQLKQNPQIIYQAVNRYLVPKVDVMGMARSVLGREAWMKATAAEKTQFSQEFTRLVIRTYATPLAEYTDETVKFLPIRGALSKRFIRVNSLIIRSTGKDIPLSYSLIATGNGWKIYDLSVEGVSLLQSFRSQFAQVLNNSSMQDLIKQMRHMKKAG